MRVRLGMRDNEPFKIDKDGYKHYDYHIEEFNTDYIRVDTSALYVKRDGEMCRYSMYQENQEVIHIEIKEES